MIANVNIAINVVEPVYAIMENVNLVARNVKVSAYVSMVGLDIVVYRAMEMAYAHTIAYAKTADFAEVHIFVNMLCRDIHAKNAMG